VVLINRSVSAAVSFIIFFMHNLVMNIKLFSKILLAFFVKSSRSVVNIFSDMPMDYITL
jgi:hypothetical protein